MVISIHGTKEHIELFDECQPFLYFVANLGPNKKLLILAWFNNNITKKLYGGVIHCRKFKVSALCGF